MTNAFIVGGCRLPIGNFGGSLSGLRADDMLAHTIKVLTEKYPQIPLAEYADVVIGCANQAGEDNRNVARMSLLLAGLPYTVPGETINRLCASGMSAVIHAARAISCGDGNVILAGGVENMTRAPLVISKSTAPFGRDHQMADSSFGWRFVNPRMQPMYGTDSMGETAENLAEKYQIGFEAQNEFALHSHQKAAKAREHGRFDAEIAPVGVAVGKKETKIFTKDEFIKPDTTLEKLAKLKPVFRKGGTVTAGNASGLNDGAACLLMASEKALLKFGLRPLAKVVSSGRSGVEPRLMGIGPVKAAAIALKKAGLTLSDMDVIEINEAFAVQVLACIGEMGIAADDPRLNPNGGAIALGHPLGMSGARILLSAAIELSKTGKRYALATMCIGVGQGYAVVIENAKSNK